MRAVLRAGALLAALAGAPALARDARAKAPAPDPDASEAAHRSSPPDAGTRLSKEDAEVVANLELLQHLDESRDLDELVELSQVDADDDGQ